MELLQRFSQGDLDAFEALFRQHQAEVYGWIVRIVRDRAAAEELTLETFWRIYRAHARFDPQRSFGAWARRIASNLALDHLQRARAQGLMADPLPENATTGPPPDPALRRELGDAIQRAFHSLPAKLRVAATLALIEERPYDEIAEALGASIGTIKSRVFRAARMLREKLTAMGVVP